MKNLITKLNTFSEIILESFNFSEFTTQSDVKKQYESCSSFTDFMPIVDYLEAESVFLLEDYETFACGLKFKTLNSEGFPESKKAEYRDKLLNTLNHVIPKHKDNPIVANVYFANQFNLDGLAERIASEGKPSPLKDAYDKIYKKHLRDVTKQKGIFTDTEVTDQRFSAKDSTGYLFIYRRGSKGSKSITNLQEIMQIRDNLLKSLSRLSSSFQVSKLDDKSLYNWLFPLFNKQDNLSEAELLEKYPFPDEPYEGRDFSSLLILSRPESDVKKGVWSFCDRPSKFIITEMIKKKPPIGAFTASTDKGAIFDSIPPGVILSLTIVFLDQEDIKNEIIYIDKKSVGDSAEAELASDEAKIAKKMIASGNPIFPIELGFFVFADDKKDLIKKEQSIKDICSDLDLLTVDSDLDFHACDTFLRSLPCAYRWNFNKARQRSIKCTLQHISNYLPVVGRGRGSGTPTQIQFNRGGEEMCFDVIKDRAANSHLTIVGSSGAGKSAKLVDMFLSYMAQHNPRFVIIEKGESLKNVVEYAEELGKSTTKIKLNRTTNTSIPPFANAVKALLQELSPDAISKPVETLEEIDKQLDENIEKNNGIYIDPEEDEKDYLGEMEILAKILVTGGDSEKANKYGVVESSLIRKGILKAAERCLNEGKEHPLISDVADALSSLLDDPKMRDKHKDMIADMVEGLNYYCKGLSGHLFNRPGELWKEADITHIDLGDVTRDGKHAELAVAYASILNSINDIAERDQKTGRPIIVLTDEAHNVVSKNSKASAILVPAIVKIVKMWRKLNAWNWHATQNVSDYCDEAKSILKLNEWMFVLAVEPGEDKDISRLKRLTPQQESLLASVTKQKRAYTEGFVICRNSKITDQLFRNIPPSITLTLGWSDPEEKEVLGNIMNERSCTELQACKFAAMNLDEARGFSYMEY